MSELPFNAKQFETGRTYWFSKEIQIPIYDSPTVEELLYVSQTQNANQMESLVDFAVFFINARCETDLTRAHLAKVPVKKLKKLMEFFNREAESMGSEDGDGSKNEQTGELSIGDSDSITLASRDSIPVTSADVL